MDGVRSRGLLVVIALVAVVIVAVQCEPDQRARRGSTAMRPATVALPLAAPRAKVPTSLAGAHVIEGRVVDLEGQPIAGTTIDLELAQAVVARTVSDLDGGFSLAASSGDVLVKARADGFALHRSEMAIVAPVTRVELQLAPGGVIRGRVARRDGAPCPAARVEARSIIGSEATAVLEQRFEATADDDGVFVLDAVQMGVVELTAGGRDCLTTAATRVELGAGETIGDVELVAEPAYAIAGVVVGPDGHPVAGVKVRADDKDSLGDMPEVVTDGRGRFRLEPVMPGQYDVHVESPEHLYEIQAAPQVLARDVEVVVRLARGATIVGRVTPAARATLAFRQTTWRPHSEQERRASQVTGTAAPDGRFELRGVPEGTYTLEASTDDGREGSVEVKVDAARVDVEIALAPRGTATLVARVVDTLGDPIPYASLTVRDGNFRDVVTGITGEAEVPNLRGDIWVSSWEHHLLDADLDNEMFIELTGQRHVQTFVVADREATIHGRVLSAERAPLGGIVVSARPASGPRAHTTITAADGTFVFVGVTRVAHHLRAASSTGDVAATGDAHPDRPCELVAQPRALLRLVVRSRGRPATPFAVFCDNADEVLADATSRRHDGTFVSRPLPHGPITCDITASGSAARITATLPTVSPITVELAPAATITGRVVDRAGRPIEGARGYATSDGGREWDGMSDEHGHFEITHVAPGPVVVDIIYDRRTTRAARFDAVGGARRDIGTVVVDRDGMP